MQELIQHQDTTRPPSPLEVLPDETHEPLETDYQHQSPAFSSATLTGEEIKAPDSASPDFSLSMDFASTVANRTWLSPAKIIDKLSKDYSIDTSFDPESPNMVAAVPSHFTDEQQQLMFEARNEDHWLDLLDEFNAQAEFQEELALGGPEAQFWAGVIGVFDPTALLAIGMTEGAALTTLARGQKLKNMSVGASALVTGGAGATSGAVYSALRAAQDADYDEEDAMIDMALGTLFSGVTGSAYTAYHKFAKARIAEKVAHANNGNVNAAKADPTYNEAYALDFTQNARMKKSESIEMREAADKLTSSGAKPNGVAADATSDRYRTDGLVRHNRALSEAFAEYRKDSGVKSWQWFRDRQLRKEMAEQAGDYQMEVDSGHVRGHYHPAVIKYAKAVDELNASFGHEASSARISGFEEFEGKAGYFKKRWMTRGASEVRNANGDLIDHGTLEKLIFQGLKRKVDPEDWTPERQALASKIAFGFSTNLLKTSRSDMKSLDEILFDQDGLSEYLREELSMSAGDVQKLVTGAFKSPKEDISTMQRLTGKKTNPKKNVYDRAKKRMDLDMHNEVNGFKLSMFVERDLEKMTNEYIMEMSGHLALAKHLWFSPDNSDSQLRAF